MPDNTDPNNPNPPTPTPETPPTFTQEQLNNILADERRKTKAQLDKLAKDAGDKKALETQLAELNRQYSTKEQLAEQERNQKDAEYKAALDNATKEAGAWQSRYVETTVQTAITRGAVEHEAFSDQQLYRLIGPDTRVVEVTDSEGKPTGQYKAMTKVKIADKELELPTEQAIGKLREANVFPNQFKVKGQPGTGTTINNAPSGGAGGPDQGLSVEDMIKKYAR